MPKTQREQARVLLAKADIDLRTAEVCLRHGEDAEEALALVRDLHKAVLAAL